MTNIMSTNFPPFEKRVEKSDEADLLILIEDCEKRESRLNDWERGFIDSVKNQYTAKGSLSFKQTDRLMIIWAKATEKG